MVVPVSPLGTAPGGAGRETAADGTPYLKAFNNGAPVEVRAAVASGALLWSVPWRAAGQPYFRLFDTACGPVLMTDIGLGWSYAWGWPDAAAAVRHVRRHTAEADLEHGGDYLRRRASILLDGPWGAVVEQNGHARAILHAERGPETRWYPSRRQALDAAAAHARDACAWASQLRGSDPAAREAERQAAIQAAVAALTPPAPRPRLRAVLALRSRAAAFRARARTSRAAGKAAR
jgi:hypothetical protein